MMKHLLFLTISTLIHFGIYSQFPHKLTSENNNYRHRDSLYKYQVEYKDPGSLGRDLEWDFTNLSILDGNYLIKYFYFDEKDTSRICGLEHRTRYYYKQQDDYLWATGFENYTTQMEYTTPELKMKYPFLYGDTLFCRFQGTGRYSNILDLRVGGFTQVKAEAEGILRLPQLKGKALRIHTQRHYMEVKTGPSNHLPNTLQDDSIRNSAPADTLRMTLDAYSWYVKDIRYPVFESIKTTLQQQGQDTAVFHTSFYYTPEELLINEPEEEISDIERVITEVYMLPNPVVNNMMIDYNLTRPAVVRFLVHNNLGISIHLTSQRNLPAGHHFESIPMSNLTTGTYTVYVHVDDMVMSRLVVKK